MIPQSLLDLSNQGGVYPLPYEVDMSQWAITTKPAVEPVTLEDARTFVKVDDHSEDSLLSSMISAARDAVERFLGRALIQQSITITMDYWPGQTIRLPVAPLISITEIRTLDEDLVSTVYASSNYFTNPNLEYPELYIKNGCTFPYNTSRFNKGYQIEYKAGYGTAATSVPQAIKTAILLWVAEMYENRIPETIKPPEEAMVLLNQYKIPRI